MLGRMKNMLCRSRQRETYTEIIETEGNRSHLHLCFLFGVRKKYKEQRDESSLYMSVDREKPNSREREVQQKKDICFVKV